LTKKAPYKPCGNSFASSRHLASLASSACFSRIRSITV
jgi:hypothetical protein